MGKANRSGDYINIEAAKDYLEAQEPELKALRETGSYSPWQYMTDLPAVGAAKFNVWRKTEASDAVDGNMPGDQADLLMEQMREAAKREYAHGAEKNWNDKQLGDKWNAMKSGWIYMKDPRQK